MSFLELNAKWDVFESENRTAKDYKTSPINFFRARIGNEGAAQLYSYALELSGMKQESDFEYALSEFLVIRAIELDDARLLSVVLFKRPVEMVGKMHLGEYISKNKGGIYLPILLSAYLNSDRHRVLFLREFSILFNKKYPAAPNDQRSAIRADVLAFLSEALGQADEKR